MKSILPKKDKCKKVDSSNKGRILKSIKEIEKLIGTQGNGVWPNNAVTILERNLFEIIRILEKCVSRCFFIASIVIVPEGQPVD